MKNWMNMFITGFKELSLYTLLFTLVLSFSCSKDKDPEPPEDTIDDPIVVDSIPDTGQPIFEGEIGKVWVYDQTKSDDEYILVNDASDNRVYLMDKEAKLVYEWDLPSGIGNDAELLSDGRLLVSLNADEPVYDIGGYGGRIQLINPDRSVAWDFHYSSEEHISHHDVEMLPNGNVLFVAWEKKTSEEALQAGYDNSPENEVLLPETLIEINPANDEIVWEWHSWDHLVQDFDETKDNFGDVFENPGRIDINYKDDDRGDIMHANGLDYDVEKDLIYLSVNFYSEVWVIDHSTTTQEAASSSGGNFNRGGNLVYRFGNPSAYRNEDVDRLFFGNHFPNILQNNEVGAGNMLIYMNGNNGEEQSRVFELDIPNDFNALPRPDIQPFVIWEFTDSELFAPIVSGAIRLNNGNVLIAQGNYGYWEVTPELEVVWKFQGDGLYWRGYSYPKDHPGVQQLELN